MRKAALLFVYGTMLSEGVNHARLRDAGALFLGEFQTLDRFTLHVRDKVDRQVPLAARSRNGHPLRGQLYALPWLAVIDRIDPFEGHPEVYRRERVRLRGLRGVEIAMYVFRQAISPDDVEVQPVDGILAFDRPAGIAAGGTNHTAGPPGEQREIQENPSPPARRDTSGNLAPHRNNETRLAGNDSGRALTPRTPRPAGTTAGASVDDLIDEILDLKIRAGVECPPIAIRHMRKLYRLCTPDDLRKHRQRLKDAFESNATPVPLTPDLEAARLRRQRAMVDFVTDADLERIKSIQ